MIKKSQFLKYFFIFWKKKKRNTKRKIEEIEIVSCKTNAFFSYFLVYSFQFKKRKKRNTKRKIKEIQIVSLKYMLFFLFFCFILFNLNNWNLNWKIIFTKKLKIIFTINWQPFQLTKHWQPKGLQCYKIRKKIEQNIFIFIV